MKNSVEIKIAIEDQKVLDTIYQTIDVELSNTKTDRGEAYLSKEGKFLILKIIGSDFVAIRGLTNSSMRLLKTSLEIVELLD